MHPSHARPAGLLLGLAILGAALLHQPGAIPARAEIAAPGAAAPPASGAGEPGGDLPTVEVTPHPVHAVPEGDPAPPLPVTIRGRDGSVTALRAPPAPARYTPSPPPVTRISGAARVADVVSLSVLGRAVRLFGVRAPQAGDLCPASARRCRRRCATTRPAPISACCSSPKVLRLPIRRRATIILPRRPPRASSDAASGITVRTVRPSDQKKTPGAPSIHAPAVGCAAPRGGKQR